jgi:hypothetical protein
MVDYVVDSLRFRAQALDRRPVTWPTNTPRL